MNCATFSASAPAITSMFPPTARDCSTSGGPRPCWPSWKPHDETSPHVREHRLYLLARVLTEPHIEQVSIEKVASARRVNPRRATLSFSGLAHRIRIHDADIYRLHAEQDDNWKSAPRRDAAFSNSVWDLDRIKAELM